VICCCICLKKAEKVLCQVDKDDKNVALVVKGKKDMSKVRCFACHKAGHYANQCPIKKEKKSKPEVLASAEIA
jgi:uncharacterized membrane protein